MPRSILARRSWWRRIIAVMAIAPPTITATIGTSRPPKLVIASTNLIRRLRQGLKPCFFFGPLAARLKPCPSRSRRPTALWNLRPSAKFSGGADRDRTGGLLVANQALSQLSYSPNPVVRLWPFVVRKSQRPTTRDQRPIRWWAWVELNYRPHP